MIRAVDNEMRRFGLLNGIDGGSRVSETLKSEHLTYPFGEDVFFFFFYFYFKF